MLTVSTPLTLALAKAFGIYMIAGGLSGMLLGRRRWQEILDAFENNAAVVYLAGVVVFALGAAIVMAHNIWTAPLAIFVSLIGWVAAVEGVILIAYPDPLLDWARTIAKPAFIGIFAVLTILLGAMLLTAGFAGGAG